MGLKTFTFGAGETQIEAFVHPSVFDMRSVSSSFHSHAWAELHITLRGSCVLHMGERVLHSEAGTVTVIPSGMEHRLCVADETVRHIGLLIAYTLPAVVQKNHGSALAEGLAEELRRYGTTHEFYPIAAYLGFLCRDLICPRIALRQVENREFLIREFFSNRYNEAVTLEDLAKELHLCARQTARLVREYMGDHFSNVLLDHRIRAAKRLLAHNPALTLSETAQLVGYGSYAGFWKAFKRFENGQKKEK